MTIGSIVLLAIAVAVVVIGSKVRHNSQKLQELEELMAKD